MTIKFFFKKNCPKCPSAKAIVKEHNNVEYYDLDSVDGMAEGAFHMVYSAPSILLFNEEGREVKSWRGDVPEQKELQKNLLV